MRPHWHDRGYVDQQSRATTYFIFSAVNMPTDGSESDSDLLSTSIPILSQSLHLWEWLVFFKPVNNTIFLLQLHPSSLNHSALSLNERPSFNYGYPVDFYCRGFRLPSETHAVTINVQPPLYVISHPKMKRVPETSIPSTPFRTVCTWYRKDTLSSGVTRSPRASPP